MTHESWQDMIPFYVAGSLPALESSALEQHLSSCAICMRILEEWREVARVVKAETEVPSRRLPPLPAEIRAERSESPKTPAAQPSVPTQPAAIVKNPYLRQASEKPSRRVYSFVAAFVTLLFGGLVLYLAARGSLQKGENPLTIAEALTPDFTMTPIAVFGSSNTSGGDMVVLPTSSPLPQAFPPTSTPRPNGNLFLPPTITATIFLSSVPTITLTPEEFSIRAATQCVVTVNPLTEFGVVNIRRGPGEQYDIINAFSANDAVVAIAKSDNGWYRVQFVLAASVWTGWAEESLISLGGPCADLPLLMSAGYTPDEMPTPNATPTAHFNDSIGVARYEVITLEDIGPIPANTHVRISSAYFTGTEWMYTIVTADETTFADARQSQIQYAFEVTPDTPAPTILP